MDEQRSPSEDALGYLEVWGEEDKLKPNEVKAVQSAISALELVDSMVFVVTENLQIEPCLIFLRALIGVEYE